MKKDVRLQPHTMKNRVDLIKELLKGKEVSRKFRSSLFGFIAQLKRGGWIENSSKGCVVWANSGAAIGFKNNFQNDESEITNFVQSISNALVEYKGKRKEFYDKEEVGKDIVDNPSEAVPHPPIEPEESSSFSNGIREAVELTRTLKFNLESSSHLNDEEKEKLALFLLKSIESADYTVSKKSFEKLM